MNLSEDFFKKVQDKTNVSKDTIISLANKLKDGNMKNPDTLREVIGTLSKMTGKEVSKEKEEKIIATIMKDEVPKNVTNMF